MAEKKTPAAARKTPTRPRSATGRVKSASGKPSAKKTTKPPVKKAAAAITSKTSSRPATTKSAARKAAPKSPAPKKTAPGTDEAQEPKLEISASRQFNAWLAENRVSLGFTTYQTGKVFLIGLQQNGRLSVFERTFNRCMGLCVHENQLYMSSLYQLWRFQNALAPGQVHDGFDRVYVPINGHTTGDLDIHDIAVDSDGRVVFVNTLFSCLSVVDESASFAPIWKPPFVSKIAAEDRCHLNGLAMENGKPRYVTAVAETDVPDGWREKRSGGGCIIDVDSNQVITRNLSMPHSPRVYRDKLYVLNSGTGEFGSVDRSTGDFQPMTFCPGYMRGLSFHGDFAVIGLSKPRENRTFSGLPLDANLTDKNAEAQCGLYIIDLRTGDVVHWMRIEGIVQELYDVVFLENVIRPKALGFKSDEIRRTITVGNMAAL